MEVDDCVVERSCKRKLDSDDSDSFRAIGIVYDELLLDESDKHPRVPKRSFAVFSLLRAYDLLKYFTVLESRPATFEDLCNFHSSDYIEYLKNINKSYTPDDEVELDFGLGYDCPAIEGIFDYCCAIGGSSISAAKALLNGSVDVALNWCGGWHHAQRDEAEGFCYINDICLGILELRKTFENVLYFDLDVHHGNGVENAFSYTKRVMTVSLHLYEPGFYPGTGSEQDIGFGSGSYYSVNVPLQSGASDPTYISMFDWILSAILDKFVPDAVVIQCGADGLSGFPLLRILKDRGYFGTGTIRENRIPKDCPILSKKNMKNFARGSYESALDKTSGALVLKWKDNAVVAAASTAYGAKPMASVKRFSQKEKKIIRVAQPQMIREYNKHMGGTDRMDEDINAYCIGDPVGRSFNLSQEAYGHCVKQLIDLKKPTLILGGGGYNIANTARCWAYITSIVAGRTLNSDIPEHESYLPSYELPVITSLRKDNNSPEYLSKLKEKISLNLQNL